MEIELNNIIEKIKKEGIGEAEKKSKEIIEQAQKKAQEIISLAERQARNIVSEAEAEAEKIKKLAEDSIRQSIRDATLTLKQNVIELFDSIIKRELTEQMSTDFLKEIIVDIIKNFKKEGPLDLEILLSKNDKTKLEDKVLDLLTSEMRKGVTFKISPTIEAGFRIGIKEKNFYYDFTDDALTEALVRYLNPKITKILTHKT